jgi:hypothetical protein
MSEPYALFFLLQFYPNTLPTTSAVPLVRCRHAPLSPTSPSLCKGCSPAGRRAPRAQGASPINATLEAGEDAISVPTGEGSERRGGSILAAGVMFKKMMSHHILLYQPAPTPLRLASTSNVVVLDRLPHSLLLVPPSPPFPDPTNTSGCKNVPAPATKAMTLTS